MPARAIPVPRRLEHPVQSQMPRRIRFRVARRSTTRTTRRKATGFRRSWIFRPIHMPPQGGNQGGCRPGSQLAAEHAAFPVPGNIGKSWQLAR